MARASAASRRSWRSGIDRMMVGVDDEAEPADFVFVTGDKETALFGADTAPAARCGDALDKALLLLRRDRRNHDPIGCMLPLEGAAVLLARLARSQNGAEDRFPDIGPGVLDGSLGAAPLECREEMRKGDGYDRPLGVLLVPSARRTQHRMHLAVPLGRQLETAMASGRMGRDALGIEGSALRHTPGRIGAAADLAAAEPALFATVFGPFDDLRSKCRLIGEFTGMAVEIRAGPFRHRPSDAPAADEIVPAVAGRRHGIGMLADKRDRHAVGAAPK
ncbi:hypothetical protein [Mesorhizobium sp. M3A.F.Ca.ET.080.04.2.1]|uniref:hypothetical protein n=1 Tax=Mesorhizobium sp. M3A.F.Ca.ET.080.04.2.1 TaxID=2493676 RepID=UPI001FDF79D4|nr:hypothetical protein [Mesorhizobium sp. M3A.F.Ca.ET.080.04.2.1]